jgi:hypothetical protein
MTGKYWLVMVRSGYVMFLQVIAGYFMLFLFRLGKGILGEVISGKAYNTLAQIWTG